MVQRFVHGVLGLVLTAALASAQTLTVPTTINSGDDISIGYCDSARAGQTIVVRIVLATPELVESEVLIHLDQKGRGSITWTVPEGWGVTFNAPGCRQVSRAL